MSDGMLRFGQDVTGDIDAATSREWLETNGLGGFASSTIVGMNTRRYHGLLIAATDPPVGRLVMLSKLEETLVVEGKRYELSSNRYPDVIHPQGHLYLKEFRLDPFPVFTYEAGGVRIEKRIFLVHGENTAVIEYELFGGPDCLLEVGPLIAFRDFHSTTHRNGALRPDVTVTPGMTRFNPYDGLPALYVSHNGMGVEVTGYWYLNLEYAEERSRGLDYREDLFNPFVLTFSIGIDNPAHIVAGLKPRPAYEASRLRELEIKRRALVIANAPSTEPIVQALTAASGHFLVSRGNSHTIIAGYPWFSDWGRDTMISLPGLTLVTGRVEIAKSILLTFANSLDQGMLPNRFPDTGEVPEYNTVDATLWFFEAIRALLHYTAEHSFVLKNLYPCLKHIIDWHLRGTRYGIRVDEDGLLHAGEPGAQLTWMDSKIGDWLVTPRHGKPVEIQALWYNALKIMEDLARRFEDPDTEIFCREFAERVRDSFNRLFWNPAAQCLFDVLNGEETDASIRPNQILAISLAYTMLPTERAFAVVSVVQRELLTPLGLRTLAPGDSRYRARYEGGVWERDSSYHQGTVWPWLMGPFLTAYVRVHGNSANSREQAAQWLNGFQHHLQSNGLGQISEIADADPPHRPRGCIAQAWSVAELLRAAVEDVFVKDKDVVQAASV